MNSQRCVVISNQVESTFQTVHALFSGYARGGNASKLVCGEKELSYQALEASSSVLASFLINKGLQVESLVGVLMERSIDAISAQLGILKSGGAYLPLSPLDFPVERIRTIFEDAKLVYVVTETKYRPLIAELEHSLGCEFICFYMDDHNHLAANESGLYCPEDVVLTSDNLAYVMFTSGSTGKPKGVMVTHRNILSTVVGASYFDASPGNIMLHAAPISFDAATFEIWGALLNGLSLHIAPSELLRDFDALASYLQTQAISTLWLTSALFNLLSDTRPEAFSSLAQLMVGGEALSPEHINKIRERYPTLQIRNNYGPTENTVFSTSFLIDQNYEKNIPIGSATRHKRAYILNEALEVVNTNTPGILFVAGDGLARGYLNRPEETRSKFIPDPFYEGENMYNSGDLCCYNDEGEIEYLGRVDEQVKVLGHRIELGEIETVLRTCPQIHKAVVLYKTLGASAKGLVAYVDCQDSEFDQVKRYLASQLPDYMLPAYYQSVSVFPINVNGKLDRKFMQGWPVESGSTGLDDSLSVQDRVISLCREMLGVETLHLALSFFEQGGDSLSGTRLTLELERVLSIELPLTVLYGHPILREFISVVDVIAQSQVHSDELSSIRPSLAKEAQLVFDVELNGRSLHLGPDLRASQGDVFLTGATGFFGAFFLRELLTSTMANINCLVRAKNDQHASERIFTVFDKYKIPISDTEKSRIYGIAGDLSLPCFGLEEERYEHLANSMDIIFHNGASVNYVDSYETLKLPNVIGSQEVIRLSCLSRIIPVHYVSSVSVFETLGFFTGREMIFECDTVDETEGYVRLGYSQSKWVAEKMMENARDAGLPINIYRSGYLMGHSETGVSNTTDHIARYIAGCVEMGCAPVLEEYATLAPVDQISRALCHIATRKMSTPERAKGETFHLCNPVFVTVDDIYQKVQDFGFPLELVSYNEWKERLKQVPDSNPLYPLLSLHVHRAPGHELTLPELYEQNTRFDCSKFIAALEDSGIEISLDDASIFERWLHNYVEQGLISEKTFNLAQAKK